MGQTLPWKKFRSGSWILSFTESLLTKGLKFKDSNVVLGAVIVHILAELTFKL